MDWEQLKGKNCPRTFGGAALEYETEGGYIKCVTLKAEDGSLLRLRENSYEIACYIPKKPKLVKKFKLSGKILGVQIETVFDTEKEATSQSDRFREADDGCAFEIKEIEVPEE